MVRSTCKPGDKLKEGRRSFTIFYERLERRPTGSLTTAVKRRGIDENRGRFRPHFRARFDQGKPGL